MREGRRDPATRGYGWLATLGGAALLLLLGFGVGLLTGSLFEEPDLVARQLSGEAQEHPLPPAEGGAEAPAPDAPAASPPGGVVSADAGSAPTLAPAAPGEAPTDFDPGAEEGAAPATSPGASASAPAPRLAPAAAPAVAAVPAPAAPLAAPRVPVPPPVSARGPGFAVQVGAFAERPAADQLVGSLRGDRFAAYVVEGAPGEGARFRVRVGPFASREEASGQAAKLKARRRLPTWVIREGGP